MLADVARQRCARSWSLTIPASRVERRLDEPVAGCVNGQLIERARNPAPLKQLAAFGPEKVDAPADAVEVGAPATVSEAEVAAHPTLNGVREQLCDQFGKLVRVVFYGHFPSLGKLAVQVGGVQHQKPDISDRDSPDGSDGSRIDRRGHRSVSRSDFADFAFWVSSNQYSSNSGPISVSTTCLNHSAGLSMGVSSGGVT